MHQRAWIIGFERNYQVPTRRRVGAGFLASYLAYLAYAKLMRKLGNIDHCNSHPFY